MEHTKTYVKSGAAGGAAGALTQIFISAVSSMGPTGVLLWAPFAYFSGACAGKYAGRVATEAGAPEGGTMISAISGFVLGTALGWGGITSDDAEMASTQQLDEPTAIVDVESNVRMPIDTTTIITPKIKAA
ncbi:MAG: hypothetical protein CL561_08260 [Alphaproteobacteria bacterium]|nr:hypothetical protein [Alphaproteobacteria bacterium]